MEYTIRPACMEDARQINDIRRTVGVMENLLCIPSETYQKSEEFFSNADQNSHQFVAVTQKDGKEIVIGTAGLHVNANHRLRHSGTVGILVHKDYQGIGVGTALMKAVLDVADNWLMLVRVELTVFTDNRKALHLYEKMGFEREGILRKAAIRNGEYADEYIMSRIRNQ